MAVTKTFDEVQELSKFSENAKRSLIGAFEVARKLGAEMVFPDHVFVSILKDKRNIATRLLMKLGVDTDRTVEAFSGDLNIDPASATSIKLDQSVKDILTDSFIVASEFNHVYVGTEHILLSLMKRKQLSFVKDFEDVGLDYKTVQDALLNFATYHPGVFKGESALGPDEEIENQTATLDAFSSNMNELAENGKYMPIVGRDDEVQRLLHVLSRKTKSNPILVGEAGVGKTAVVEGLVQRVVGKNVPDSFHNKKIINIDLAGILAGSKIRGDVEERVIGIVEDASKDPDVILFIDEIHMIVGAGTVGQGSMDIANILKPYLTSNDISLIGATTFAEYQRHFESDSALTRRFQPVFVDEVSKEEALQIMQGIKPKLEKFHDVEITNDAILQSVNLSDRYVADRFLPDKAIDLLDEASAGLKIENQDSSGKLLKLKNEFEDIKSKKEEAIEKHEMLKAAKYREEEQKVEQKIERYEKAKGSKRPIVFGENIQEVVSKLTKIPVEKMDSTTAQSLINLNKTLEQQIIGQPDAVKKVSSAIRRAKVGIGDQDRPLASFLFLGPTGVGKTQLAKTIAKEIFGNEKNLIQIDMSEYMEQHSVSKFIGSPPGYVGHQEGGQLTEKIRRNPHSVVLFDEIEKAHPELLNILLQVLEEGRLQDSKGRVVNCKNCIIIMTSNIGAEEVMQDNVLGFSLDGDQSNDESKNKDEEKVDVAFEEMREGLMEELKDTIRPELLNRIDDIVVFRGLDDTDAVKIVKLEISKVNDRIAENNIMLSVSRSAYDYIASEGMSAEYGARNIKRKIQEIIENPLAQLLLEKNLLNPKDLQIVKIKKVKAGLKLEV